MINESEQLFILFHFITQTFAVIAVYLGLSIVTRHFDLLILAVIDEVLGI